MKKRTKWIIGILIGLVALLAILKKTGVIGKEKGTEVPECSICLDKKLNRVFIPCGHTTCETCAERLVGKACPMCKKLINQAIPLFL